MLAQERLEYEIQDVAVEDAAHMTVVGRGVVAVARLGQTVVAVVNPADIVDVAVVASISRVAAVVAVAVAVAVAVHSTETEGGIVVEDAAAAAAHLMVEMVVPQASWHDRPQHRLACILEDCSHSGDLMNQWHQEELMQLPYCARLLPYVMALLAGKPVAVAAIAAVAAADADVWQQDEVVARTKYCSH